jgi:hypothetical protein
MTKINNSDELIEMIRSASRGMNFEQYADSTGISKELIFRILKGEVEQIDDEVKSKLSLKH